MTHVFLIAILAYSLVILALLFSIDLKTRLLPNRYVLQFFFAGLAFHIVSGFSLSQPQDLLIAAICGSGLLLAIRSVGNKVYGFDTLGLGDVKLIGAAGIWLGVDYIFMAIALGALAGLFHGFYLRFKSTENVSLQELSIPAGPGFIVGIVFCTGLKYHVFLQSLF